MQRLHHLPVDDGDTAARVRGVGQRRQHRACAFDLALCGGEGLVDAGHLRGVDGGAAVEPQSPRESSAALQSGRVANVEPRSVEGLDARDPSGEDDGAAGEEDLGLVGKREELGRGPEVRRAEDEPGHSGRGLRQLGGAQHASRGLDHQEERCGVH